MMPKRTLNKLPMPNSAEKKPIFAVEVEIPKIEQGECFEFGEDVENVRFIVEWTSKTVGIICDLDLTVSCYDERARFIEKLDCQQSSTRDGCCELLTDIEFGVAGGAVEAVKLDFSKVDPATTAILLYLDGGPRNFQFVQSVSVHCIQVPSEKQSESMVPVHNDGNQTKEICQTMCRTRKDYQGLALCVLYKNGWYGNEPKWTMKAFLEPLYLSTKKGTDDSCAQLVVGAVPALERFRPRLFGTVRDLCTALSSVALPRLKKKFQKVATGLPLGTFTEVIFRQLYESHPRIVEENEAGYTVAMIQEMFNQIDYNGDLSCDWDEFTTFCIQNAFPASSHAGSAAGGTSLDEYIIEYGEDMLMRDHVLSAHRYLSVVRFVPDNRRLIVIPEDSDNILIMDEKFRVRSQLYPSKLKVLGALPSEEQTEAKSYVSSGAGMPKVMIYDAVYLSGRDMYAFCSSDHAIVVCKEHSSMSGKKTTYFLHNKFYHSLLHLRLCWSGKNNLLCSVASDRVIYGWDIDRQLPIFQVSRHSDIITDFIACDHLDMFITCSMDRRIVMWSAVTRRVKGILIGHKRGVRCLSVHENTLLSAGFECEAKTWDLVSKDPVAILKGHRRPVVAAKLMCEFSDIDKDHRAITVDEGGEFRLWNIYVKERASEPTPVPTLQVFEMASPESPLNQFRFLFVPFNKRMSTSYYSDMIAGGTKLLHFLPEKNAKEFVPPTSSVYNESTSSIMTAVGHNLLIYDVCGGHFVNSFPDIINADLTCLCLDGIRGRRVFVGCGNGAVLLVNCISGAVIDKIDAHHKEVTCIETQVGSRNKIFTASLDGRIRMLQEAGGQLHIQNTVENAFGEGVGVTALKIMPSLRMFVAAAAGKSWAVWNEMTFKKMMHVEEESVVTAIEILGASRDAEDIENNAAAHLSPFLLASRARENIMTIAVATTKHIHIYTIDVVEMRGITSHKLQFKHSMYITDMRLVDFGNDEFINYSRMRSSKVTVLGQQIIATTDDGTIISWRTAGFRWESEKQFRRTFYKSSRPRRRATDGSGLSEAINKSIHANLHGDESVDAISAATALALSDLASETSSVCSDSAMPSPVQQDGSVVSAQSFLTGTESETISLGALNSRPSSPSAAGNLALQAKPTKSLPLSPGKNTKTPPNETTYSVECPCSQFGAPLDSKIIIVKACHCWSAHLDSIATLIPLTEHGCVGTVSLDGFHRVWNLDEDCLGELQLPNITERMKNPRVRIVESPIWKFILETITISQKHREIANTLIDQINTSNVIVRGDRADRRKLAVTKQDLRGITDSFAEASQELSSNHQNYESTALRNNILQSLVEPLCLDEDAPPDRVMTQAERKIATLMHSLEVKKNKTRNRVTTLAGPGGLTGASVSVLSMDGAQNDSIAPGNLPNIAPTTRSKPSTPSNLSRINSANSHHNSNGNSSKDLIQHANSSNSTVHHGSSENRPGSASSFDPFASTSMLTRAQSLWTLPEDSHCSISTKLFEVPPAFSEMSIARSMRDGMIDDESYKMLRTFSKQTDKVFVYERTQPVILLRNPNMSVDCQLPPADSVRRSEVNFGNQKDMYKNANRVLEERNNLSNAQMRKAVVLSRIDYKVRKVNTMVHVLHPLNHDEVVLPQANSNAQEDQVAEKLRSEDQKMKLRLLQSAALVPAEALLNARPLDKANVDVIAERVNSAMDGPEWEARFKEITSKPGKTKKIRQLISQSAKDALEKKLAAAIKDYHKAKQSMHTSTSKAIEKGVITLKKDLTTRSLLPYYKLEDVRKFMDIFAKVDEDFSGDLDLNEWVKLFTSLNQTVSLQEARMIFIKVDGDSDGYVTMKDLVPVVFNKANRAQRKLIVAFAESEIIKKNHGLATVTTMEMEQLFEAYDTDNIGFVLLSLIRERIRAMQLPEAVHFAFMDHLADMADDDMVNLVEFSRMFKLYISKGAR